jgi:hypothetical protein
MIRAYGESKEVVGAWRFELQTSCAQGRRATRLRYAPTCGKFILLTFRVCFHSSESLYRIFGTKTALSRAESQAAYHSLAPSTLTPMAG